MSTCPAIKTNRQVCGRRTKVVIDDVAYCGTHAKVIRNRRTVPTDGPESYYEALAVSRRKTPGVIQVVELDDELQKDFLKVCIGPSPPPNKHIIWYSKLHPSRLGPVNYNEEKASTLNAFDYFNLWTPSGAGDAYPSTDFFERQEKGYVGAIECPVSYTVDPNSMYVVRKPDGKNEGHYGDITFRYDILSLGHREAIYKEIYCETAKSNTDFIDFLQRHQFGYNIQVVRGPCVEYVIAMVREFVVGETAHALESL